ncbi:MAG: hypothetical protein AAFZ15_13805 [Bacteroidota bacterium]
MSITKIANELNHLFKEHSFSNFPATRKRVRNLSRIRNIIFSDQTIKEGDNYAFHHGGRKELQFNIEEESYYETIFRFGLGISLQKSTTVTDPMETLIPVVDSFNKFFRNNSNLFSGHEMWHYKKPSDKYIRSKNYPVQEITNPELQDFYFIGKYFDKDMNELDKNDLKEILDTFYKMLPIYEAVMSQAIQQEVVVEERVARICWNTNGWIKPSGRIGKSKYKKSHEYRYGFGHEEWLFDFDKNIDGFHYAFLQPIHRDWAAYVGKTMNIKLYTVDGKTKKKYWVGSLKSVEVINYDKTQEIIKEYKKKGWIDEMKEDLENLSMKKEDFGAYTDYLFNIRFIISENKNMPSELIEIENADEVIKGHRYNLLHAENIDQKALEEKPIDFAIDFNSGNDGSNKLATHAKKEFTQREIELPLTHNELSDKFLAYMQKQHGKKNVKRECSVGNKKVDIVWQKDDGYIYYELKTYNSLLTSLRVAIGQMFEYNFYPEKSEAKELYLVSNLAPPDENFRKYIKHLNKFLNIKIGYIYFCLNTERIIEKI